MSIELEITKKLDAKSIDGLASSIVGAIEGKTLRGGSSFKVAGVQVKVKKPAKKSIKVDDSTEFDILVRPTTTRAETLLAIDSSYSMRKKDYQPSRYEAGKNALLGYLAGKVGTREMVGVVTFGRRASEVLGLKKITREDVKKIAQALSEVRLVGRTSIGNLIKYAVGGFSANAPSKKLILLTDGADNIGTNPIGECEKAAKECVQVYAVLIGKESHYDKELLMRISSLTGGECYYEPTEKELKKLYRALGGRRKKAKIELPQPKMKKPSKAMQILKIIKKKVW